MTTSSRALSALLYLSTSSASKLAHPLLSFLKDPPSPRRLLLRRPFSTTATPYPLYYELVDHRPPPRRRSRRRSSSSVPAASDPCSSSPDAAAEGGDDADGASREQTMDRSKRKYYRKRRQRMFGGSSDSDDAAGSRPGSDDSEYIELKPEIVDFPRLHAREEELYFYDAFAYPWEKEKHYRMVYQLEKKYFPEHSLDKAFVDPGAAEQVKSSVEAAAAELGGLGKTRKKRGKSAGISKVKDEDHVEGEQKDERALIFFGDEKKEDNKEKLAPRGVTERKVEEFFKCLRKVPNPGDARRATREEEEASEPYLLSRKTELPPRWDGPAGTVVLVDKPKGWTSFTVCGKLRRLVKVQKVGHAGTLDPMATGLLIVCVGKATKLVDRYQGMVKGYSGVFRLGEATSTWDADSPVIQREPWEHIKDDDIRRAAASFLGEIWQVPPMFSAIKVGGEKMYEKARRGEMVELSPRRIYIQQFDIERSLDDRQNLVFRVTCSKGTYIRSLCADLGKALGSCAHLTALRRDSIGDYSVNDAWNFEELQEQITKGYF